MRSTVNDVDGATTVSVSVSLQRPTSASCPLSLDESIFIRSPNGSLRTAVASSDVSDIDGPDAPATLSAYGPPAAAPCTSAKRYGARCDVAAAKSLPNWLLGRAFARPARGGSTPTAAPALRPSPASMRS